MAFIKTTLKYADKRTLYVNSAQILHIEEEEAGKTLIILVDGTVCICDMPILKFMAIYKD
jgi:hypothetical protein